MYFDQYLSNSYTGSGARGRTLDQGSRLGAFPDIIVHSFEPPPGRPSLSCWYGEEIKRVGQRALEEGDFARVLRTGNHTASEAAVLCRPAFQTLSATQGMDSVCGKHEEPPPTSGRHRADLELQAFREDYAPILHIHDTLDAAWERPRPKAARRSRASVGS